MNVELICVGSELLAGDVVNTNAAHISKRLRELGHESFRQYVVDDNKERLSELVSEAFERCDLLITTGGLGPTDDDITKETVCESLGLRLVENPVCIRHLEEYFKSYHNKPTQNNYKQATAPEGAKIIKNDLGTACGIYVEKDGKKVIMLPGPPRELVHMFDTYVVPYLKKLNHHAIVTHTLNVFGMGESLIETLIKSYCGLENPVVATYCGNNECAVQITATAQNDSAAESLCAATMLKIKEILGDNVYGVDSKGLAHEVVGALRASEMKISTAESCTGGMLSQSLTSIPHSSDVVEIGILAYSNRIKNEALSVPFDVLEEYGAISPETAMYLAKNVRILSGSDIGVGITGNAGPSASENKPVGLVYVSIADKTKYFVKKLELPPHYDREKIRSYATLTALDLVRRYLSARPAALPGMISYAEPHVFEENKPEEEPIIEAAAEPTTDNVPRAFDPNMNFMVFDPEDYDGEDTDLIIDNGAANGDTASNEGGNKAVSLVSSKFKKVTQKLSAFMGRIFPAKNDRFVERIIKVLSIIAVIGLIVSSVFFVTNFTFESTQRGLIEDARDNFEYETVDRNDDTKIYTAFEQLLSKNPDIKGWISISNTNIDNPVYQTDNNDYYLTHNMNKDKSRYGALYFDCGNTISAEGNSKNLTIYGHNMRDKSMFGTLSKYRSLKFYKNNPIVNLKTLYDQQRYIVFAVIITNATPEDDNGYLYNFTKSDFASDEEFNAWINEAKERSLIDTGITVTPDDNIITLSTCCYDFDNARFVVMAKSINEEDTVASATLNKNVRYPQAWYDKNGLDGYNSTETESSTPSSSQDTSSTDSSETVTSDPQSSETDSSENSSSEATTSTITSSEVSSTTSSTVVCTHEFTRELATPEFLCTNATCTNAATYYISCTHCGEKSNQTFVNGEPAPHSPDAVWHTDDMAHWHICLICGGEVNTEPHYPDNNCEVCGYIKETTDTNG
ncbi:MAG: competence/damage-inducible protein A [Acutalibacteraceae bacterium]|nr:competence/damage-inducible protein A [Acutalibacteraceae bacterium]